MRAQGTMEPTGEKGKNHRVGPEETGNRFLPHMQLKISKSRQQPAHRKPINAGNPSVFFCLQLCQICGTSWMHRNTVPIVPRAVDAVVTLSSFAMAREE